jgi:hypothetical protein
MMTRVLALLIATMSFAEARTSATLLLRAQVPGVAKVVWTTNRFELITNAHRLSLHTHFHESRNVHGQRVLVITPQ